MNQKEILLLSIGAFLTIIAWILIDVVHIAMKQSVQNEFQIVSVPKQSINPSIFSVLEQKKP